MNFTKASELVQNSLQIQAWIACLHMQRERRRFFIRWMPNF